MSEPFDDDPNELVLTVEPAGERVLVRFPTPLEELSLTPEIACTIARALVKAAAAADGFVGRVARAMPIRLEDDDDEDN